MLISATWKGDHKMASEEDLSTLNCINSPLSLMSLKLYNLIHLLQGSNIVACTAGLHQALTGLHQQHRVSS